MSVPAGPPLRRVARSLAAGLLVAAGSLAGPATSHAQAPRARPGALHGARITPVGGATLHAAAGLNVLLPTLVVGATTGVAGPLDVGLRYEVHAGLGHVFVLAARARVASPLALALELAQGFFAAEELAGIRLVEAPFGNALVTTPRLLASIVSTPAVHVALGLGVSLRWVVLEQRAEETRRSFDPAVQDATLELAAEWPLCTGVAFLRFVALVPIQAELRVLGFLPSLVAGRTWDVP